MTISLEDIDRRTTKLETRVKALEQVAYRALRHLARTDPTLLESITSLEGGRWIDGDQAGMDGDVIGRVNELVERIRIYGVEG